MERFDVQVLGAGIVGKSLALSLARLGLRVALRAQPAGPSERDEARSSARDDVRALARDDVRAFARDDVRAFARDDVRAFARDDVRAFALSAASVALLDGLKVWAGPVRSAATPVFDMQVHGDAPGAQLSFSAWQQRSAALAWITDAQVLDRELAAAVRFAPHVEAVDGAVEAPLSALCEGGSSGSRAALGVVLERKPYAHQAIAARLVGALPHRGTALQWFRAPDVLALLPFDAPEPGRSFALVWSMPDEQAASLMAADASAFESQLHEATGGAVGRLTLASPRAAWPLALARASAASGPGWVLLGDAAHVVHPLAGQGLNMGLADVAALTGVLAAREPWRALGDARLLRRYARARRAPTWAMGQVTDGLLELFSRDAPPLRELRNRGLTLVDGLAPVKRWLADRALRS